MTAVCDDCHAFKQFGEKCWFFWNDKKSCSQHKETPAAEPKFRTVHVPLSRLR